MERTVEIDQITQHPDLESDMRYLMELREKLAEKRWQVQVTKKREAEKLGSWEDGEKREDGKLGR